MALFERPSKKIFENMLPINGTKGDWLIQILEKSGLDIYAIYDEVDFLLWEYAYDFDLDLENDLDEIALEVSKKLIKWSAVKGGTIGGITSTPASLPVIGAIGAAVFGSAIDVFYLIRTQIELCYAISAAYQIDVDHEKLKNVALALLGFSSNEDVATEIASTTFKTLINETALKYANKGSLKAATEVAGDLAPRLLGKTTRLIPIIGISFNAGMNVSFIINVGNQAIKYFRHKPLKQTIKR